MSDVNISEIFQNSAQFSIAKLYKSASGARTILLNKGVTLSNDGEGTVATIGGVTRKVEAMFVNSIEGEIEFLKGLNGTENRVSGLQKDLDKGATFLVKAKLG